VVLLTGATELVVLVAGAEELPVELVELETVEVELLTTGAVVLVALVLLAAAVVLVVLVLVVVVVLVFPPMRLPIILPRLPRLIEVNSLSALPLIPDERTLGNRQNAKIAKARTVLFMIRIW